MMNKLKEVMLMIKCLSDCRRFSISRDSALEKWTWNGSTPTGSQPGHQLGK